MSNPLRLEDNKPIRIYPDDFAVWLTAVPTDEIADIIDDEAFNKLMVQYEKELPAGGQVVTASRCFVSAGWLRQQERHLR